VYGVVIERTDCIVNGHPADVKAFPVGGRSWPFTHCGCIDGTEKNGDFLVGQSRRRQIAEQPHCFFRRNTNFLSTFPSRSINKSFVRLDPPRDEFD